MELIVRLDEWFDKKLEGLSCSRDTRAYVSGVLTKYRFSRDDMSRSSIVLSFADAKLSGKFEEYQKIGDWVLFVSAFHPKSIKEHKKIIHDIGTMSYVACHKIMMGKWPVYEELSQKFPHLIREIANVFNDVRSSANGE